MKKVFLFVCILFSLVSLGQTTDWVKSFGGVESDKGISIGVDSLGYVYCSGWYNTEATFGNITLKNNNSGGTNKENFIFKMDSLGNVLWAIPGGNQSGGCCDDRALGMHVTPGGDVFITGTFWSSYYLGVRGDPGTINVTGNNQINAHDNSLLAKIDTDGNPVWVIGFGGDNTGGGCPYPIYDADDHSYDVTVDKDGFIYVTGFFSGYDADFDNFTITNPEWGNDCQPMGYIGKLDASGNWLWVDKFDGIKDQRGSRDNRIAIDKYSNIYVVGGFQNRGANQVAQYGPFSLSSNGEWDAFVFKMDKDGNWIWAKGVGSNKTDRANGIAVDVCDDIYITGEYRNPMVFLGANASNGSDTLSHRQKRDVFVAKINSQGEWKWAKRARSSGTDKPYQMSVDANKQVFLGGTMKGEATFSSNLVVGPQIPNDTSASAWVAQLDGSTNTGDWVWAKMGGCDTDDDDRTNDVCPDGFGNVYAIGFYEDFANFDGTILNASGRKKDIFVWKMSMVEGSFSVNNTYDTIFTDSMVFSPIDTGLFFSNSYVLDGCDTLFVDSVIHQRLGVNIVYDININGTTTSINANTELINFFTTTKSYFQGDNVVLSANIAPGYYLKSWSAKNNLITNSSNNYSFVADYNDTIVLNISLNPTVVYTINEIGTNSSINIDGVNINIFPASFTYNYNELITLSPIIDPVFAFGSWSSDSNFFVNGGSANNSFYCQFNDTIVLNIVNISAKIFGNDTLCSNENEDAELEIFFTGNPPFLFSYTDGINEYSDSTSENLYVIKTQQAGLYTITSFSDANGNGATSGQARVVVLDAPQADFEAYPDSMTILYSTTNITDKSLGNIVSWQWYFGDNTPVVYVQNPTHIYKDSIGIYEVSLIISDDQGCVDTTAKYVHITDDYWIYIPNSFTPDNDKKNDFFCISYNGIRENTFVFNVYNRFSDLVYSTNNINDLNCENNGWDGRHIKTGEELPAGAYVYEIYYQDFEGWKHNEMKQIFIVR